MQMMRRNAILGSLVTAFLVWGLALPAHAAGDEGNVKVAQGLAVYLGVLPAAMIQGHPVGHPETVMHGGIPRGRHTYHVMAAIFDARTGDRIKDAKVEARVTPPGLAGTTRRLDPMVIAETITYGNYFTLDSNGAYRVRLAITPQGTHQAVTMEFTYEHRIR